MFMVYVEGIRRAMVGASDAAAFSVSFRKLTAGLLAGCLYYS